MRRDSDILNDISTIGIAIVLVLLMIVVLQWIAVLTKAVGM